MLNPAVRIKLNGWGINISGNVADTKIIGKTSLQLLAKVAKSIKNKLESKNKADISRIVITDCISKENRMLVETNNVFSLKQV